MVDDELEDARPQVVVQPHDDAVEDDDRVADAQVGERRAQHAQVVVGAPDDGGVAGRGPVVRPLAHGDVDLAVGAAVGHHRQHVVGRRGVEVQLSDVGHRMLPVCVVARTEHATRPPGSAGRRSALTAVR